MTELGLGDEGAPPEDEPPEEPPADDPGVVPGEPEVPLGEADPGVGVTVTAEKVVVPLTVAGTVLKTGRSLTGTVELIRKN